MRWYMVSQLNPRISENIGVGIEATSPRDAASIYAAEEIYQEGDHSVYVKDGERVHHFVMAIRTTRTIGVVSLDEI